MNSNIVELAKLFKNGNKNSSSANFVIGKVISPLPNLKISDGSFIILDRDNLIVTDYFYRNNTNIKANDLVLMIPSVDEQNYVVIDKVVTI